MTALGDVISIGSSARAVCLMTAQAANSGSPADGANSALGVPVYCPTAQMLSASVDIGLGYTSRAPDNCSLVIASTAGSGVMTGTFTLWRYFAKLGIWIPYKVNAGAAIAETGTDTIRYAEAIQNLGHYDRLYLELSAVGGTATAFEAWLVTSRPGQ